MAYMPKIAVVLDGVTHEVQLAQGDYVRAEADGYSFTDGQQSAPALARVSFHALHRAKRRGLITGDVPESWDDFLDVFEFPDEQPEEVDPKGSSQAQAPG